MYIISMTTLPCRRERLSENLPSITGQSYNFDKLVINIDDNLTEEDYLWYDSLKKIDSRIEINKADYKWRSCNKLLPTLQKYPNDIIITVDDDIYYPVDSIKYLVEESEKNPDCVIAHEVNPIIVENGKFKGYVNGIDVKLGHKEFGKYLSNCCLFPPHIFNNTDLFNYDKMMECTEGNHDELWFWINSTINGVPVINLDYVLTFEYDVKSRWTNGEYRLHDINISQEKTDWYNKKVEEMYGKKLYKVLSKYHPVFKITKDNVYSFITQFMLIVQYYASQFSFEINMDELTLGYKNMIINFVNKQNFIHKN